MATEGSSVRSPMNKIPQGRILVTGATGFLGRAVMAHLCELGADPIGVSRHPPAQPAAFDRTESNAAEFDWRGLDLLNDDLVTFLDQVKPGAIIHCAGSTRNPVTSDEWTDCIAGNLTATERLLSAAAGCHPAPRVVVVSSAAIYAPLADDQRWIDEQAAWCPSSRYGVAKAAATMLANLEVTRGVVPVAIGIPFNILGPGQPGHQVPQTFIDRLRTGPDSLDVGDLSAIRDWLDIRDVAQALVALADSDTPCGLYNIASGQGISVQELLERTIALSGTTPEIHVESKRSQHSPISRSIGNPSKLQEIIGWRPKYSLDESLRSMFDYP